MVLDRDTAERWEREATEHADRLLGHGGFNFPPLRHCPLCDTGCDTDEHCACPPPTNDPPPRVGEWLSGAGLRGLLESV